MIKKSKGFEMIKKSKGFEIKNPIFIKLFMFMFMIMIMIFSIYLKESLNTDKMKIKLETINNLENTGYITGTETSKNEIVFDKHQNLVMESKLKENNNKKKSKHKRIIILLLFVLMLFYMYFFTLYKKGDDIKELLFRFSEYAIVIGAIIVFILKYKAELFLE